ncbi:hypothetical protein BS50DRAFT_41175 [Corynespora cassiicola Philippines]|uniref:TORC1 subunit TCO89 domain-containing protein n=1 Tax=Corynespora cassiicola Philippines TaxID=1448308 RepID=A0A2T2PCU6_CORCC|nr:hypothetical protein BS50DRAFT_41175 [Corynespora cassiicola Philippines]
MASSSADAHSQPKRPAAMARQPSTSSHVSQSPSETHKATATPHKAPRQHVVGKSRMQRNASFGKNLDKLNNKSAQASAADPPQQKHHRRSQSGNSASAPSSPRPGFKRNASSGGIVRAANHGHGHTAIRKNHSSGHLARQSQSKVSLKSSKSEVAPPKRSLAQPGKARQHSPDSHPTVHFDVGDEDNGDEGADDGWTEESASQSPTTTRSNTRSNSVVLDHPHKTAEGGAESSQTREKMQKHINAQQPHQHPLGVMAHALPDRTLARQTNGGGTHQHSRPPDADMITSRLLQRSSSRNPLPQTSNIAATVMSDSHDARVLSQSAGSTLVDTPGRDLVSRFMDGDGSAGTPKDSSFLPSRNSPQTGGDMERIKRNKSMPNVAGTETPTRPHSRRSGATTPTDLPPSRTQQKLLLQRASSNIEPQKLVPTILPRTGAPATYLHSGMTYNANGEGRLDPRLQHQFNHVAVEYSVVRRYRNPLADSISRIEQIPGTPRRRRTPKATGTNGHVSVHGSNSLSGSFNDSGLETGGSGTRRARVSLENGRGSRDDGEVEGRQSFESDHDRIRNEAEEICRRLWESTEVVEGD